MVPRRPLEIHDVPYDCPSSGQQQLARAALAQRDAAAINAVVEDTADIAGSRMVHRVPSEYDLPPPLHRIDRLKKRLLFLVAYC